MVLQLVSHSLACRQRRGCEFSQMLEHDWAAADEAIGAGFGDVPVEVENRAGTTARPPSDPSTAGSLVFAQPAVATVQIAQRAFACVQLADVIKAISPWGCRRVARISRAL
jgi:hypothetical protein